MLFSLFLAEIPRLFKRHWEGKHPGVPFCVAFPFIFYDVVISATSHRFLYTSLDFWCRICSGFHLTTNLTKTKAVIFHPRRTDGGIDGRMGEPIEGTGWSDCGERGKKWGNIGGTETDGADRCGPPVRGGRRETHRSGLAWVSRVKLSWVFQLS